MLLPARAEASCIWRVEETGPAITLAEKIEHAIRNFDRKGAQTDAVGNERKSALKQGTHRFVDYMDWHARCVVGTSFSLKDQNSGISVILVPPDFESNFNRRRRGKADDVQQS